jgi:5'-3' exoribonuclease 1
MIKASEALPGSDPDDKIREIKIWLKSKGVRDFEPVSIYCDQLTKVITGFAIDRVYCLIVLLSKETVSEIEALADTFTKSKSPASLKKAIVKGIPRQAVLKPSHVAYRLQNQHFAIGDRVTMVQDSGGVPLSVKGVVVGLNAKSMDVVWDVPFMSGITLGNRSVFELWTC